MASVPALLTGHVHSSVCIPAELLRVEHDLTGLRVAIERNSTSSNRRSGDFGDTGLAVRGTGGPSGGFGLAACSTMHSYFARLVSALRHYYRCFLCLYRLVPLRTTSMRCLQHTQVRQLATLSRCAGKQPTTKTVAKQKWRKKRTSKRAFIAVNRNIVSRTFIISYLLYLTK